MKTKITTFLLMMICVIAQGQSKRNLEYQKIVTLIQQQGYIIIANGEPIYKKMTFMDTKRNIHEMRFGGALINKIVVDSYYRGDRSVENWFSWEISPKGIQAFPDNNKYWEKNKRAILFAFKELLKESASSH